MYWTQGYFTQRHGDKRHGAKIVVLTLPHLLAGHGQRGSGSAVENATHDVVSGSAEPCPAPQHRVVHKTP